jgi:hypothetical protein
MKERPLKKRSETPSDLQLELLDLEPRVSSGEVEVRAHRDGPKLFLGNFEGLLQTNGSKLLTRSPVRGPYMPLV